MKIVLPPANTQDESQPQPTQTPTDDAIWAHLTTNVKGTPAPLTDTELAQATDWAKVRKCYRLNGVPALDRVTDEDERRRRIETLAVMGMALRGL